MTALTDPYTFANDTIADAVQVNARFKALYDAFAAVYTASAIQSGMLGPLASLSTTDIPGLSITHTYVAATRAIITARAAVELVAPGAGDLGEASLICTVDGAVQAPGSSMFNSELGGTWAGPLTGLWVVDLAAGAHTIKIRVGVELAGAGAVYVRSSPPASGPVSEGVMAIQGCIA